MSGRIPDSFIEELLGRTDIVEVTERRLDLKRAGNEFHALCPFHEEKTPSFTVSPRKQFYHCFGCGAHGSAIGFLMQFEGLDFVDAVEDLAHSAGLQVPRSESREHKPRTGLYEILDAAAKYFQAQLREHPEAVEYLKSRGLSGEISRDFGVGYAPSGWDGLHKYLGTDEQKIKLMHQAGLLSQGKAKAYDKFRDRIMFPIHDRRGRVIAFGGRALADDGPKYLNSPETELFHKGRELYGLYLARQRTGRLNTILVVEGYMDVVALAQFGFNYAVATLGTATTAFQAELLLRAADTVIYCFDGDAPGRKAAWRALESTLPKLREGLQARFLFLPEGEDPDSLVRKSGKEAFERLLVIAQPLSDFFFNHFTAKVDMESLDGRAVLIQMALPYLEILPEGVFKDMMKERLETLARHRLRTFGAGPDTTPSAALGPGGGVNQPSAVARAMAHLVQYPGLASLLAEVDELRESDIQGVDILLELIDFCENRPNMTTAQLLELFRQHSAYKHLCKLAAWNLPGDDEHRAQEFTDSILRIRLKWVETLKGRIGNIVEQRDEYRRLEQRQQALKNALQGRTE